MHCLNVRAVSGAVFAALLLGAAGAGAGGVFYVDGMAVDGLVPTNAPPRFNGGIRSLSEAQEQLLRAGVSLPALHERPRSRSEIAQSRQNLARAQQYLNKGELDKAMLELRDGLALNPTGPELLSRAAIVSATLHRFSRAEFYFRRYLETKPKDIYHLAAYAAVLIRLAKLDEADQALKQAEALNPDYMPTRFNRACLRLIQEDRNQDRAYWRERSTDEMEMIANWLHSDREDLQRVMGAEDLRGLCELTLGPGTSAQLPALVQALRAARQARQAGKFDEAVADYQAAKTCGADAAGLDMAIAECALQKGDMASALTQWKRIADRFPQWAQAWLSYGHVLIKKGDYPAAVEVLKKANELAKGDAMARFVLACAYALNGDRGDAQPIFNEIVQQYPKKFRAWLDADPRFNEAVKRMPNSLALMQRVGIPPESQ